MSTITGATGGATITVRKRREISIFLPNTNSAKMFHIMAWLIGSRIMLMAIASVSADRFSPAHHEPDYYSIQSISAFAGHWDAAWYTDIAINGYSTEVKEDGSSTIGFFPLYPMAMWLVGRIGFGAFYAGFLISNVCLLATAGLLYEMAKVNCSESTSLRSISYLFAFPAAFMLSCVLSESLFLFLVIASFWAVKKDKLLLCGILGMLASLTKPQGIVLFVPLVMACLQHNGWKFRRGTLWMLLIGLGPLLFAAYTWWLTGDFLAYIHRKQTGWGVGLSNPFTRIVYDFNSARFYISEQTAMSIVCLGLLGAFWKKIELPQLVFGVSFILFQSLFDAGASTLRYFTAIFPLYIVAAKMTSNRQLDTLLSAGLWIFQLYLLFMWATGHRAII